MDLESFPMFNLLPPEIRIVIWVYSMRPSTVYVKPVGNKLVQSPRNQSNPAILQVCGESRLVALSHYELAPDIDNTYVNFSLDTIHIDYIDHLDLDIRIFFPSQNESRFQYLVIDWEWVCIYGMDYLVKKVSRCHSLQQLTIVVKFSSTAEEGCEAELSPAIVRYKAMTESEASDYLARLLYDGNNMLTFTQHCEVLSSAWACHVREHFSDRTEWPKILVISRQHAVVKYGGVI